MSQYIKLRKAIPGYHKIDGKIVRTDSAMEARIMRRLVKHGFGDGRMRRYQFGISTSLFRYTPDVHLSIFHNDMSRRALVEFKPISTRQFNKKSRLRMLAAARFFRDSICLLFVEDTKRWYVIEPNGKLFRINEPMPGYVPVSKLPRPRVFIPHYNPATGRTYWERPGMFVLRKTGDGIGFMVREVFGGQPRRRYYKRRR